MRRSITPDTQNASVSSSAMRPTSCSVASSETRELPTLKANASSVSATAGSQPTRWSASVTQTTPVMMFSHAFSAGVTGKPLRST